MKKLNITYDTMEIEDGAKITGETCYTVEFTDKVADNLLDHGTSGVAVGIIEKMLMAREILMGRHYLPGSIKHYELVKEGRTMKDTITAKELEEAMNAVLKQAREMEDSDVYEECRYGFGMESALTSLAIYFNA